MAQIPKRELVFILRVRQGRLVAELVGATKPMGFSRDDELYMRAVELGCFPLWADGIFGWGWHCGCSDNAHGSDQQCSIITAGSLAQWDKK